MNQKEKIKKKLAKLVEEAVQSPQIQAQLKEIYDFGAEIERARLIKVLEGMKKPEEGFEANDSDVGYNQALSDAIQRIKG